MDGKPFYAYVTIRASKHNEYESGIDPKIATAPNWWPKLDADARIGIFDEELFCDMASFAFDDFAKSAGGDTVPRHDACLALAIKEFCDAEADICRRSNAAQLVAKALCTQVCIGWQKIDGEVSSEKLAIFKDGEKVLIDMKPIDLSSLLEELQQWHNAQSRRRTLHEIRKTRRLWHAFGP